MENRIKLGDSLGVLKTLKNESIDCVVTSPPYWALRNYGVVGQLGLEPTFQEYIIKLCDIFDEVKRVLKKEGTCFVNLGDTYGGSGDKGDWEDPKDKNRNGQRKSVNKSATQKSLCQIPSRFAIEMCNRGWILRNKIIWHKPNVMPSSVKDRFTVDYEEIFFFTKNKNYYFEQQFEPLSQVSIDRVRYGWKSKKANASVMNGKGIDVEKMGERFANEKGRNKRTVWKIPTSSSRYSHVAMFPEALIEPMIKAGCPTGGVVLDIFMGAGTTAVVAKKNNRNYLGIELNPEYIKIAEERIGAMSSPLF